YHRMGAAAAGKSAGHVFSTTLFAGDTGCNVDELRGGCGMRFRLGALLLSTALLIDAGTAAAQSPTCDPVKQLTAIRDLMSLAIGPLVDLGPGGDPVQLRGPGQAVVPRTTDCKVHRTDYKSRGGHDLSYYCEMLDAEPRGRDHKRIVRK